MRFIVFLLCSSLLSHTQESSVPYLFYENGKPIVRSVVKAPGDSIGSVKMQRPGNTPLLQIKFTGHSDWNFTVSLQTALKNEPVTFSAPSSLLVLSDIEGEFEAFRGLLIGNDIIDRNYNWQFGTGHLVICGDLFDRGQGVMEYLWLLYKLEQDAKAQGGYVHVILGNHDIMNLSGDLRYVQAKYFHDARSLGMPYTRLFSTDTELGRWLRTKNIIEKIGDVIYMHAGISAELNALGYGHRQLNEMSRPLYGVPYGNIPDSLKLLFGESSPIWYRGYFTEPMATEAQVDSTLALFGVKKIVVGHTILESITALYKGKVIGIDVNQHEGKHEALLIADGRYYRVDDKGKRSALR